MTSYCSRVVADYRPQFTETEQAFARDPLLEQTVKWPFTRLSAVSEGVNEQTQILNQYDALIGDGRAGEEAPSCEGGVHVRTRCTPPQTCVKRISNGSLLPSHKPNLNAVCPAAYEIWKRGVHVRTCRCTPPQTCVRHLSNGSLATNQI